MDPVPPAACAIWLHALISAHRPTGSSLSDRAGKAGLLASIIIFGGAGGIGSAIARWLAARGDRLHLVGRDPARLAAIAREVDAPSSLADVTDPAAIAAAVAAAAQDGGLAGLVYAVGTINLKPIGALTEADFERDWRVNALGAALALKAAAPSLKQVEGSSVVLFSTVAVRQGLAAHASVSMAKGAVEGLTLALAAELAPKVRVNCIAPSLTRTPLADALTRNEALAKAVAETHALRRLGEAEDIAGLAAFLLGPDAAWITGQVIGVDGGRSTLHTKG